MPATTDLFTKVGLPGSATTLSSPGYTIGDSSINVGSTSNWPADTLVCFAIDRAETVNGQTVRIAGTYNEFSGIVSADGVISSLTHEFGPAQDYAAGALTRVYIPVSSTRENKLVEGLDVSHNPDGSNKSGVAYPLAIITDLTNAQHNHHNAAGGGEIDNSSIDWSTFSLNMKSAVNTGGALTNSDQDLAAQGLTLSFTVASNCNALVSVSLGIGSTTDYEFAPEIRLDGTTYIKLQPAAALGSSGDRANVRGFSHAVPLTAGTHTLSAGVLLSNGSSLIMAIGSSNITAFVLGKVTA